MTFPKSGEGVLLLPVVVGICLVSPDFQNKPSLNFGDVYKYQRSEVLVCSDPSSDETTQKPGVPLSAEIRMKYVLVCLILSIWMIELHRSDDFLFDSRRKLINGVETDTMLVFLVFGTEVVDAHGRVTIHVVCVINLSIDPWSFSFSLCKAE
jgi:hypothetical protein